jgi:hypothetical protein
MIADAVPGQVLLIVKISDNSLRNLQVGDVSYKERRLE